MEQALELSKPLIQICILLILEAVLREFNSFQTLPLNDKVFEKKK